jgi:hypothetical protein
MRVVKAVAELAVCFGIVAAAFAVAVGGWTLAFGVMQRWVF